MQDILSPRERSQLNDFFSLLHIDPNTKQYFSFKKRNGATFLSESEYCINHIYDNYLPNNRLFYHAQNCYFYINEGKIIGRERKFHSRFVPRYKFVESRKSADRTAFNAFYFDFDIKRPSGKHFPLPQLQQEKAKLLPLLKNVPHTAIIESANGYHFYLAIHQQDRHISESLWRDVELQIQFWLQTNVSPYIDSSVKDPARILRIPSTYHKKSDSDLFKVKIVDLVHKQFTIEGLQQTFNIDSPLPVVTSTTSTNRIQPFTTSTNNVVSAIENLDTAFFKKYIFPTSKYTTTQERIDYIKSFDMLYFLQIDELTQNRFSSIIRTDRHPSAFIDCVTHNNTPVYLYTDLGLPKFSKDLVELVKYIANISNKQALRFLCDIFFSNNSVTHKQQKNIHDFINDNVNALTALSKKNKQLHFIEKLIPTYVAVCDMFRNGIELTNVPIKDYILEIGQQHISQTYKIPKSNVIQHIKLMYHLGIINRAEPLHFIQGKTPCNTCYLKDITHDTRLSFIERASLNLKLHYPNVMKVTKNQLKNIEIYW